MREGSDKRLAWAREKAGFETPADFIRAGHAKGSTYYGYENGSRPLPLDVARKFAPILKVRAAWLFEEEGTPVASPSSPKGSAMIPRISWVSAGRLTRQDSVSNVDLEDYIEVASLPKGNWVALTVQGGSMDRVAPDGSTILVNRDEAEPLRSGGMYVFQGIYGGSVPGEATFKRYRAGTPPRLQPFSTDPDEETIVAPPELSVFGRVRRVIIDL